jgi:hypothetical protein
MINTNDTIAEIALKESNKCDPLTLDVSPELLLEGKNEPFHTKIEPVTYTHPL